jgi:D-galacturonate reductase
MFLKNRLYCKIVVGLTLIDLRRRGKTGRLGMCGTNGKKFPDIRKHMQESIGDVYKEMDLTMDWWSVKIDLFFCL